MITTHDFIPIAVETTGVLGPQARNFLSELGRRLMNKTGDRREAAFLRQRLDIAICRGNALAFRGSYRENSSTPDMFPSVAKAFGHQESEEQLV